MEQINIPVQVTKILIPTFFISGNTPSTKNNRVWTGKHFIMSEASRRWIKNTRHEWKLQKHKFIESIKILDLKPPYCVEFTFIRKTKHRFDYINIAQGMCDQMKDYGWIEDDNADIIKPYFGDFQYDSKNPGCIIKLLPIKPIHYDLQTFG